MARVVVTGATGFVGRHVVKALLQRGHTVRAVGRSQGREGVVAAQGVEVVYADVADPASWKAAMEGAEAVVHLVAIIRERRGMTFDSINHQGAAHVASAAREAGVRAFLHLSALGVQDNSDFPYLRSKWQGEQAVAQSGVPYTILRSSLVFGPGDEFINTLAGVVKAFPLVPVAGDGRARFQPIHVDDVARCIADALDREELRGKTLELGGPEQLTYDGIIDSIALTYFLQRWKLHVPIPIMRALVWLMELLLPNPPITMHQLNMLAVDNVAEPGVVQELFGFTPRPLHGNIDYIKRITFPDAYRIALGFMPRHIRDH
ncbi:MAG: complex I NDUFA9 subunit family protein [Chloroflexi bacterium]|nr:complex I NDUFA9 subunit family protein [Chloroflexota bacterium]